MNDRVKEELLAAAAIQNAEEVLDRINVPELNFLDFINADGMRLTTNSTMVAAVFGKRHDHVLRDIRNLIDKLPINRLPNFEETVSGRANPSGGGIIHTTS